MSQSNHKELQPRSVSAWEALLMEMKACRVPDAALIRAAYLEHQREEQGKLHEQIAECLAMRDQFVEAAELISPSRDETLQSKLDKAVSDYAQSAPKPSLPRFTWGKLPFLRRFVR